MPILHLVVLALVQGITEFLPISSSAHLILVPVFTGWTDQGPIIDVALHVGTLGAVILYFWRDLWAMLSGLVRLVKGRRDPGAKLAGYLVLGTLPILAAGFAFTRYFPDGLRDIRIIGWATLGFGVLLYVFDRVGMTVRRVEHMGVFDVLVIGCAQVLALIPGTSRSGITMSAARMLGFERPDAARFSMLLSIPTILGAGTLESIKLWERGNLGLTGDAIMAAGLAFAVALLSIAAMMAWLKRSTFTPFVVYRVALGGFLLVVGYGFIG